MCQQPTAISFDLPGWLDAFTGHYNETRDTSSRMQFVVSAAAMNIKMKTGGPFAAAIFESHSGKLVSLGVNVAVTQNLSMLHAEMVAIALAQRVLGTYDLGAKGLPSYELMTSVEPCAMCLGAIPWCGVRHVISGALDEDVRSIGFDEGPKPPDWVRELEKRKIKVTTAIERDSARRVLRDYVGAGGDIYNSSR